MTITEIISKLPAPLKSGVIYQYTKWPSLLGMIKTTRNGMPCEPFFVIRSYNATFMNDIDECRLGYQELFDLLKKRNRLMGRHFTDKLIEEVQQQILTKQNRFYISSFGRIQDSLPMWRCYGANGSGIAIGLDPSILASNGFPARSCIYDETVVAASVLGLCDWRDSISEHSNDEILTYNKAVYLLSCLVKSPHFEYENEARICSYFDYFVEGNKASFNNGENIRKEFNVMFECKGDRIVSYIEIEMPISVIKGIWVGPTNNKDSSMVSLKMWLESMDLHNRIPIHASEAPYRV